MSKADKAVKRYGPVCNYIGTGDYIPGMVEESDGPCVMYPDYQHLQSRLDAAVEALKDACLTYSVHGDQPPQKWLDALQPSGEK